MRRSARVSDDDRIRAMRKQKTGSSGVIEMHVCDDDVRNIFRFIAILSQGLEQRRHSIVRIVVNEAGFVSRAEQISRSNLRQDIVTIDRNNVRHYRSVIFVCARRK